MASDDFDVELFETRLEGLKDTQDGIQQMSAWCLKQRAHHKKIVASWLNVFKRVRVEHRLVLFYLANDVIQYSKRKRLEFVESWATALQKATTMVRDEKVKNKILRIFSIWEQREIYNEEYLTDLCGLLNIAPPKKAHSIPDSDDYQNASLITSIRECVELSELTDKSFKKMPKAPNCDIDSIKQHLKDKSHSDDVEKELERYAAYIEAFNKNLQAEIKTRKNVLANLDTAVKFYANQRGEVKVVVSAYKNFGSRIKLVKKKLDEITPTLASPIPSPDVNAPSPEPDADIQLPDDQSPISMSFFKNSLNGYSSYLDGNLPFDINDFKSEESSSKTSSQPIEVIGSRSDDESFNSSAEFYKPDSINVYSGSDNVMIPGISPMPVPAVPSGGYTSLARSSQQYSDVLPPPPNPPMFGASNMLSNNMHHGMNTAYPSMNARTYNTNESYDANPYNRPSGANGGGVGLRRVGNSPVLPQQPLMPPPPMPSMGPMDTPDTGGGNNFNSSWDMGMTWNNPLDSSSASTSSYGNTPIDTPLSPPHFDVDPLTATSATLEYTEHDGSMSSAQDVDHRQLHLPAFGIGSKLGLSKEKTRQLDIDHRNLISLTGSPGANENDKKSWYQGSNETSSDVDYRVLGQTIKTIETTTTILPVFNDTSSVSSTDDIGNISTSISPEKNDSPSKESKKDDSFSQPTTDAGGTVGYDPTDMVVDMDMSDEDLDDIFRGFYGI
ncbi:uncharacterized protein LOC142226648 isoform X2 [Haematobia irritans]|uniref:uncharacterized protein LOC142226648 isoform X2 n=1 Tax=Haematobia irritans TaxID=7368 RepID=UPI003F4FA225